jgi:hypothetical protein
MSKKPFYAPDRQPDPPRQPTPGEHLWTFTRGLERRRAELREFRDAGAELQIYADGEFLSGRRFLARELALIEARRTREALEKAGWTCSRCQGELWTCVVHTDQPTEHEGCDAREGEPCRDCNTSEPPRPPRGFVSFIKK